MTASTIKPRPNKLDSGTGSKAICRVSILLRSPSPDRRRWQRKGSPPIPCIPWANLSSPSRPPRRCVKPSQTQAPRPSPLPAPSARPLCRIRQPTCKPAPSGAAYSPMPVRGAPHRSDGRDRSGDLSGARTRCTEVGEARRRGPCRERFPIQPCLIGDGTGSDRFPRNAAAAAMKGFERAPIPGSRERPPGRESPQEA